jgi:CheY-like chemotaxis protein
VSKGTQTILIADGNPARGQRVAHALEAGGHVCRVAPHGAAGLEVALAEPPSVVVAQVDLPLVDATKLAEILRANPRTRNVRFVYLGGDPHRSPPGGVGDIQLEHGAETEEVIEAVTTLLERQERMQVLEARASTELAFGGTLAELRPAELLQMLHLRGATGRVTLSQEGDDGPLAEGLIVLDAGEIRGARVGPIRGEKALFRILDWQSGAFGFEPGPVRDTPEIKAPTRAVLLEGLRQLEEWSRLSPALPPLESPVKLCVERSALPHIVHPLTQEVLRLVEHHDRVGDVVDHCGHSDYQVLRTLHTLEERGIVAFGRAQIAPAASPAHVLFNEAQCRRLRAFAQTGLVREAAPPDVKLLVVPISEAGSERFARLLAKLPGAEIAPRFERGQVGPGDLESIARLDVDGDFAIDLVQLPAEPSCAALWGFAGHRALGTIFLLDARVGSAADRMGPIGERLGALPGARTFHVVLLDEGERLSPDELHENLSLIDEASLFLLPIEAGKDPGSLLRSLFGRIVP